LADLANGKATYRNSVLKFDTKVNIYKKAFMPCISLKIVTSFWKGNFPRLKGDLIQEQM
jgi:hypothetical protein